jgi:hypothetical protein
MYLCAVPARRSAADSAISNYPGIGAILSVDERVMNGAIAYQN